MTIHKATKKLKPKNTKKNLVTLNYTQHNPYSLKLDTSNIIDLQHMIGNQAVQRLLAEGQLPSKLAVNSTQTTVERVSQDVLGTSYAHSPTTLPPIQRFSEKEHMKIGNEATQSEDGETQRVELIDGYWISYGEMVALADHFQDIDQVREYAAIPGPGAGTREEIEYVRWVKIRGKKKQVTRFSEQARTAADGRFVKMALDNRSHFVNPEEGDKNRSTWDKSDDVLPKGALDTVPANAISGYHKHHLRALREAYVDGRAGKNIERSLAVEAFGVHYLTDAFSGGHVRSERASIEDYWNARVPMFNYNLKGYIANKMAEYLSTSSSWYKPLTEDAIYDWGALETVTTMLDAKGPITFGDVVGRAVHDYDNEHGVEAIVEGQDVTLYGDDKLNTGNEKFYAIKAVHLSHKDVIAAWEYGKAQDAKGISDMILSNELFAAERLIPKAKPDSEVSDERKSINWKCDDFETLLRQSKFREGFALFIDSYLKMFSDVAKELSDEAQKEAFREVLLIPLSQGPYTRIQILRDVINWIPRTGGGIGGHNKDDKPLDYYKLAKKRGALPTLTFEQKKNLILTLLDGWTIGDEEPAILDLLAARKSDTKRLINAVGWEKLHDQVDDGPGNRFKDRYPKSKFGKDTKKKSAKAAHH